MPKLPEYEAPERTLLPSDKGASAFEQAGRRIGPAFNEAASLTREAGKTRADSIMNRRWPFDMLELERSLDQVSKSEKSGGGVNTKLEGPMNLPGSAGRGEDSNSGGKAHKSHEGSDVGGMSAAAAGLGKVAQALAKGNKYRNSEIDPATGLDMLDPRNQNHQGYSALENGELVHFNANGQRISPPSKDAYGSGPNSGADRQANKWFSDWSNFDKSDPKAQARREDAFRQTGVDPVTGQMVDPSSNMPSGWSNAGTGVAYGNGQDAYGNPNPPPIPGPFSNSYGGFGGIGGTTEDILQERNGGVPIRDYSAGLSPSGARDADEALGWTKQQLASDNDAGAGTDAYTSPEKAYDYQSGGSGDGDYGGGGEEQ